MTEKNNREELMKTAKICAYCGTETENRDHLKILKINRFNEEVRSYAFCNIVHLLKNCRSNKVHI